MADRSGDRKSWAIHLIIRVGNRKLQLSKEIVSYDVFTSHLEKAKRARLARDRG